MVSTVTRGTVPRVGDWVAVLWVGWSGVVVAGSAVGGPPPAAVSPRGAAHTPVPSASTFLGGVGGR